MSNRTGIFRQISAIFAIALVELCSHPMTAQALQAQPALSGHILDPRSTPLPDATITVTDDTTHAASTFTSDAQGNYSIVVPPGTYTVTVSMFGGVASATLSKLKLSPRKPVTKDITLKIDIGEPVMAGAIGPQEPESAQGRAIGPSPASGRKAADLVRVTVNAVPGPLGYVSSPSLTAATQSISAQQQALSASQNFNFPSIILYISAVPLVSAPSDDDIKLNDIETDQETNRNPLWLDATFTLSPIGANGKPLPSACTDGSIQVLGLLPQQTIAAAKNRAITDVASGVNDVAGALASFYPGAAGQAMTSATKALNVVFQDIFPPQPVAYEYSNMNGNCEVGWFFRPNTSSAAGATGPASILGIQTGIVLLKTSKEVKRIIVTGQTLSSWSKPPNSSSKNLYYGPAKEIGNILLPDVNNIDYDDITSLSMFPALIPKSEAMKILHFEREADFQAFAKSNKLVGTTASFDYITNASLSGFITQGPISPATDKPTPVPAPTPAPAPRKTSQSPSPKSKTKPQ